MKTDLPLKIERHSSESRVIEIQAPFKLFLGFLLLILLLILGVFDKIYLLFILPVLFSLGYFLTE